MELNNITSQIDDIDEKILKLFCERMKLVENVAQYKIENSLPIERSAREKEILAKVRKDGKEVSPSYGDYAVEIFATIITVSKKLQEKLMENEVK